MENLINPTTLYIPLWVKQQQGYTGMVLLAPVPTADGWVLGVVIDSAGDRIEEFPGTELTQGNWQEILELTRGQYFHLETKNNTEVFTTVQASVELMLAFHAGEMDQVGKKILQNDGAFASLIFHGVKVAKAMVREARRRHLSTAKIRQWFIAEYEGMEWDTPGDYIDGTIAGLYAGMSASALRQMAEKPELTEQAIATYTKERMDQAIPPAGPGPDQKNGRL